MLTFELVTLEGVKYSEDCHEVIFPTPEGQIAIFPNHMPLISVISPGVISIRKREKDADDRMQLFATDGGILEIGKNHRLRLLADVAEEAEDVNELGANEALKRAQELRANADSQVDLAEATAIIAQQSARLRVAELKRRKRQY